MTITHASSLTDSQLLSEIPRLAGGEREATVALIAHLAEFDACRLFEGEGFSSTFKYCQEILHLSEDPAFNRIEAARAARRYPAVLDMLTAGTLSPTTARMLARHLTDENHDALLAAASGRSKQHLVSSAASPTGAATVAQSFPVAETSAAAPPSPISRPVVRPVAAERYEVRFTASAETREKLRRAQDLLGHAVPSGDLAEVFDRALTLLVADLERKKFGTTKRPGKSRGQSADSRNIPADVERAVSQRDQCRCAFIARNGRRGGERRFLEFHHVVSVRGGRKADRRQHPAPLPGPQPLRGHALLRSRPGVRGPGRGAHPFQNG